MQRQKIHKCGLFNTIGVQVPQPLPMGCLWKYIIYRCSMETPQQCLHLHMYSLGPMLYSTKEASEPYGCSRQCLSVLWVPYLTVHNCPRLYINMQLHLSSPIPWTQLYQHQILTTLIHSLYFQVTGFLNISFFKELVLVIYIQANCLIFTCCISWCWTIFYYIMNSFFKKSKTHVDF